ncbi:MAG: cytidine deaminase [Anaerolineae bacterium]|nr:MAG: cytidine deaminase [Anaerolineae bacterium]
MIETLISQAREVRENAYAPYSNYKVGAALLAENGQVYTGVNVENAAYPSGMCAERSAVFQAVGDGQRRFVALALVTDNGGSPCGACRQVLAEFGLDLPIFIANAAGEVLDTMTLRELLPRAFTPVDLA